MKAKKVIAIALVLSIAVTTLCLHLTGTLADLIQGNRKDTDAVFDYSAQPNSYMLVEKDKTLGSISLGASVYDWSTISSKISLSTPPSKGGTTNRISITGIETGPASISVGSRAGEVDMINVQVYEKNGLAKVFLREKGVAWLMDDTDTQKIMAATEPKGLEGEIEWKSLDESFIKVEGDVVKAAEGVTTGGAIILGTVTDKWGVVRTIPCFVGIGEMKNPADGDVYGSGSYNALKEAIEQAKQLDPSEWSNWDAESMADAIAKAEEVLAYGYDAEYFKEQYDTYEPEGEDNKLGLMDALNLLLEKIGGLYTVDGIVITPGTVGPFSLGDAITAVDFVATVTGKNAAGETVTDTNATWSISPDMGAATLNTSTGRLSGVFTETGIYTVTATSNVDASKSNSVTFEVTNPPGEVVGTTQDATYLIKDNVYVAAGYGYYGQFSNGQLIYEIAYPVTMKWDANTPMTTSNVKDMKFGYLTVYIQKPTGEWYAVGSGYSGQRSDGTTTGSVTYPVAMKWDANTSITDANVKDMKIGSQTLYIQKPTGEWYATGMGSYGQRCDGTTTGDVAYPVAMKWDANTPMTSANVKDIKINLITVYIQKMTGEWYAAGYGTSGQLCNGTTAYSVNYPVAMKWDAGTPMTEVNVKDMKISEKTVYIQKQTGEWYAVGLGGSGQRSDGTTTSVEIYPVAMKWAEDIPMTSENVADMKVGTYTVYIQKPTGEWYAVGSGGSGERSDGTNTGAIYPIAMKWDSGTPMTSANVKYMNATEGTVYIQKITGEWYAVGYNGYGRRCDGTYSSATYPVAMKWNAYAPIIEPVTP